MEYAMVPYRWIAEIQTRLKKHRIIDASEAIKRLVMVKTPQEIQYLRESARINVQAHLAFRDAIRAGVTEKDLGIAARQAAILNGTEVLFCFVGSGEFSFAAHKVRPLNKPIKIGDFVRVDMGCIVHGYVSDFARCYILGEAPSKDRETFGALAENIPLTAQEVIPGRTASEAYERSVKNIKRSLPNFGREFVGHGIGLTLHEEPFLKRGNDIVIEPNTVVSIELSEYCSGKRYHLENSFLVTERGVELISAGLPMELEILF
jgi:Xaa-Pro aminopeptidase